MNKLTFTVAAIYGASQARANICQAQIPLPDQSQPYSVALGEQNFNYLDVCPQDQRVKYEEYEAMIADIGLGSADRAENIRIFQMMDLNNDYEISLEELLQYYKAKYSPLDLKGKLAPFDQDVIYDDVLNFLKCRAANNAEGKICNAGYTREDLKLAAPQLYSLDNIIDDHVSFEAFVNHDFALRDRNGDGIVDDYEHNRYNRHYKTIRGFWNHSKGEGNVQETILDNGIMTYDQWMRQDNMMVKRDFRNTPIPQQNLIWRFQYFDRNKDGELSWWEYWSTIQEDDIQFNKWIPFYNAIDVDRSGTLTEDEVRNYYTTQSDIGAIPADQIEAKVTELFDKYARGESVISKWPMWGRHHWQEHALAGLARREANEDLQFDENTWFAYDTNRDMEWNYFELTATMTHEEAMEYYDLLGKDPTTDPIYYQEIRSIAEDNTLYTRQLHELEFWAFSKGARNGDEFANIPPITIDTIDVNDPAVQRHLQVTTQAELEALFAVVDKNSDGEVTFEEVCRHYVSDTTLVCGSDPQEMKKEIIEPDFISQDHFDGFWQAFDSDYMNADLTEVERDDFIQAVAEVNIFDDMSDIALLASFDNYDLNDDGILSKQEAQHAFNEGLTILEVAEATIDMFDSVDQNHDDNLDETEFLAGVNLLTSQGVLPVIDTAEAITVYNNLVTHHNDSAAQPVQALPLGAIIQTVSEVAPDMWAALVAEYGQ